MKTLPMKPTTALTPAQQFFFEHAGYSFDPVKETPEEGRTHCAVALAEEEARGSANGVQFQWEQDGLTNREWTDEGNEYGTWECLACYEGEVIGSVCGVDFGEEGSPWKDNYARVVQAAILSEWEGTTEETDEE